MGKYWQFFKVSFLSQIEYRGDLVLSFMIKLSIFLAFYFVWSKIEEEGKSIGEYGLSGMVLYYLLTQILDGVFTSQTAKDLRQDIMRGYLSSYLVKPFEVRVYYLSKHWARVLSEIIINSLISFPIFILYPSLLSGLSFDILNIIKFIIFTIFSSLLGYNIFFLVGVMAFWTKESSGLQMIVKNMSRFLTGDLIPLDLLPDLLKKYLLLLPFAYILFFPIKIIMKHDVDDMLLGAFIVVAVWLSILIIVNRILWEKGLKKYESVGI